MKVTGYNVGRWCMSEDDCIAAGISFAAYERGVNDAAQAFGRMLQEPDRDSRLLEDARAALRYCVESFGADFPGLMFRLDTALAAGVSVPQGETKR